MNTCHDDKGRFCTGSGAAGQPGSHHAGQATKTGAAGGKERQRSSSPSKPGTADSRTSIGTVPGYSEEGAHAWRGANDGVFAQAAAAYNKKHDLSPGDPDYFTPERLKAWAMVESGGHPKDFATDPFQVNKKGDWDDQKAKRCGLQRGQAMTPATSAAAALEWWHYKAYKHDANGRETTFKSVEGAFRDYNGKKDAYPYHPRVEHRDWYGKEVTKLDRIMSSQERK